MYSLLIIAILLISLGSSEVSGLQDDHGSGCKHTDNGITCTNVSSLLDLYVTSESSMSNVSFVDCHVESITSDVLDKFQNVTALVITHCQLKYIGNSTFHSLKSLVTLNLSWNKLATLSPEMFADISNSLENLILAGNPVGSLPRGVFVGMPQLKTIDLSDCQLKLISDGAFLSLQHLQLINLKNNSLTHLTKTVFEDYHNVTAELALDNNPWNCDCALLWIRELHVTDAK